MSVFRFKLRTLLIAMPAIAIMGTGIFQFLDASVVYDVTLGSPSVCGVHNVSMTKKLVDLTYGMNMLNPMVEARRQLFPHADEVYDTGFCMPIEEEKARVYVCPDCSKARVVWLQGRTVP